MRRLVELDGERGLAGKEQRVHAGRGRHVPHRLHQTAEMQGVGRRAQKDGRLEAQDDVGARSRVHAAARNGRQVHFLQRVLHAPGPDMRAISGHHEHRLAGLETHGEQRPRIGPGAGLAIDMGVAEHPRHAGRSGRREHHPAAPGPHRVGHGGVGAVGRMLGGIRHHFGFVDHRPLAEIVNAADIARRKPEAVESSAVERAVLVEERHRGRELLVLNRGELVTRSSIEPRRPHVGAGGAIAIVAKLVERREPGVAGFVGACVGHAAFPLPLHRLIE